LGMRFDSSDAATHVFLLMMTDVSHACPRFSSSRKRTQLGKSRVQEHILSTSS
jgi:hypothetical protein